MKKKQKVLTALVGAVLVSLVLVWFKGEPNAALPSADGAPPSAGNVCGETRQAAASPIAASAGVVAARAAAPNAAAKEAPLSVRGTKTVRITADRTITAPLRRTLEEFGARIIAPASSRSVLVEVTPAVSKRISTDVRFTAEDVLPESKVQPGLAQQCAEHPQENVKVNVLGLTEADREAIVSYIAAQGGKILHTPLGPEALAAEIPATLVASLAERGDVRWIEPKPELGFLNDKTVVEAGANADRLRTKHQLRGRGQKVTICDSGLDTGLLDDIHLDFAGRVQEIVHVGVSSAAQYGYTATLADYVGHGTHVAGTVLGDGARSDGLYKGMAPLAELYFQASSDTKGKGVWIDSYSDLLTKSIQNGSYIHSDSWGSLTARSYYDAGDAAFDQVVWNNPDLLVVAAAGNAGEEGTGDRTISASPSCAKNVLTVGNTMSSRPTSDWLLPGNPENLNPTSSRGPTSDGRIKPEIAAPGTAVYSALSTKSLECVPISGNEYYTEMTGTSMATPLVSGTAALVREWLADRRGMTARPTAALLKAILAGGGVAMTGVGAHKVGTWTQFNLPQEIPNTDYGWGRVNLEETLYPTNGRAVKFADRIPFADGADQVIDVTTTNAAPLDVQLCWIDYPADASVYEGKTLINDLDLIVSNKTTGAVWRGNGIAGGDRTNTMESVRIAADDAPAGDYAIIVRGYSVSYASTEGGAAAVYVRGAFESETAPDPLSIRNVRSNEYYAHLDEALKAVASGDTLEILEPVLLAASVTLSVPCTIVATNADPLASMITPTNGAAIALASGATLTLTNVAFAAADADYVVTVASGAHLKLAGTVGVGEVAIAATDAIQFAAPLTLVGEYLEVDAPNASASGDAFGTWTGEQSSANSAAALVICVQDGALGGIAQSGTGKLVWGVVPCDPSIAKCVVEGTGISKTYCRSFDQALLVALKQDSILTLKEESELTTTVTLSHDLTLVADGGSLAFSTNAPSAGFVIPTGTAMVLTNLTVSGKDVSVRDCAFKVTGGDLTLEDGATLTGFGDEESRKDTSAYYGGTVVVLDGSVTMKSGSKIKNCVSHSQGGAIWLNSKKATANLLGGTIVNCTARSSAGGGAVYVGSLGANVNVAGDFTATDNTMGPSGSAKTGNLYLSRLAVLTLTGELTGEVGVSYGTKDGYSDLNVLGANFIALGSGVTEVQAIASAECFSHDADETLVGQYDVDTATIVWAEKPADDGQCDKKVAGVRVKVEGESDYRYYLCIDDAFEYVKTNATFEVKGFVYDYYLDGITKDVTIDHDVRITSWAEHPYQGSDIMILWRTCHAMYKVVAGGSLTLSNVKIVGACSYGQGYSPWDDDAEHAFSPLFYDVDDQGNPISVKEPSEGYGLISVNGGSLTLEDGARVGFVFGNASRASNAITVYNGGTVTMESGSRVTEVYNEYRDDYETSCGGGILLDRATGHFEGGLVYHCKAYRAGGLYVANESTAYVSGDIYIGQNYAYKDDNEDNIVVSKNSNLVLAGPLSCTDPEGDPDCGYIGVNEGISGDTSCFATVDWEWTDFEELEGSAEYFLHDRRGEGEVYGVPVTNWNAKTQSWDARLVWNDSSLSTTYGITIDGVVYHSAIPDNMVLAMPKAFSVSPTKGANGKQVLQLDGGVEGCWYTVYSTTDLAEPFAKETSVQLKPGETFEYEVDQTATSKFYKIVAEEGLR